MYTPEELKQIKSDQPAVKGIFDTVKTAKEAESNDLLKIIINISRKNGS